MTPILQRMCPFFIVSDVVQSIGFYRDTLGFGVWYQEPEDVPFFAIVGRDEAQLFIKAGEAEPMPNSSRDPAMRWDAYVLVLDPDALHAELLVKDGRFSTALADTHDGLRGFEIMDPDGHVIFFGCPVDQAAVTGPPR